MVGAAPARRPLARRAARARPPGASRLRPALPARRLAGAACPSRARRPLRGASATVGGVRRGRPEEGASPAPARATPGPSAARPPAAPRRRVPPSDPGPARPARWHARRASFPGGLPPDACLPAHEQGRADRQSPALMARSGPARHPTPDPQPNRSRDRYSGAGGRAGGRRAVGWLLSASPTSARILTLALLPLPLPLPLPLIVHGRRARAEARKRGLRARRPRGRTAWQAARGDTVQPAHFLVARPARGAQRGAARRGSARFVRSGPARPGPFNLAPGGAGTRRDGAGAGAAGGGQVGSWAR